LETLNLKTIVTLVSGAISAEYSNFMATHGIRHVVIPIAANEGSIQIRHREILDALAVIVKPANWPLLIHCAQGDHRTGCVVGILRRAQGMDLHEILGEYYDCAGTSARELDEEFITTFSPALVNLVARVGDYVDDPVIYHDVPDGSDDGDVPVEVE
jgi:tyrosine-protein phosphatase SIW14